MSFEKMKGKSTSVPVTMKMFDDNTVFCIFLV